MPCTPERLAVCKAYYQQHKDYINERNLKTYYKNKEAISKYMTQRVTCICGCVVAKGNLLSHSKTQRHQDHLNPHCTLLPKEPVATPTFVPSFKSGDSWNLSWK